MAVIARRYYFQGRVQGVGFRYNTAQLSANFPVGGFVKNLADGRVEMHAEGEERDLTAFLQAIQARFAGSIQSVEVEDVPTLLLNGFDVRM